MDQFSPEALLQYSSNLSSQVMESLAEYAGVGYFSLHIPTGDISLNRVVTNLTGYEPGELPHSEETKLMLTCKEDRPLVASAMAAILQGEIDRYKLEYRMRRRDSSIVHVSENAIVTEKDESGKPVRLSAIVLDLSRLQWAEEKARKMEEEARRIALLREEGRIANQNRMLRAAIAAGAMLIGGFHQDYETVLRQSLQMLGECIGADRAYMWRNSMVDKRLCCFLRAEWSKGAPSLTFHDKRLLSYDEFLPNWRAHSSRQMAIWSLRSVPSPELVDFPNMRDALSLVLIPLFLHGEFWGFIGFDNCTEERPFTEDEAEIMGAAALIPAASITRNEVFTKLNEARQAAMDSTKAKGEFLSRMSHEIRTPMNAIIGMTDIAKKSQDPAKIRYCLDKVDASSRQLLGIINDVLDMSKIDANKFEITTEPFDFEKMLQGVLNVVQVKLAEKHQEFRFALDQVFARHMISDSLRISQVLINLLNNAMKFTPEFGCITLQVQETPLATGRSSLRMAVADTGIGIDKETQKKLFRSFEQADGSIVKDYGGTGLGLAICKKITDLMGGKIWVESTPGEGATFQFEIEVGWGEELPAAAGLGEFPLEREETASEVIRDWCGKHVLLAEDIEINREIVQSILEDTNLQIDCAENGQQAVEAFSKDPYKYELILMDVQMPVMDGLSATKCIRRMDAPRAKEIPILAMTANAFKEDEQACLDAGMNGHVAKPLNVDDLLKAMGRYLDA